MKKLQGEILFLFWQNLGVFRILFVYAFFFPPIFCFLLGNGSGFEKFHYFEPDVFP